MALGSGLVALARAVVAPIGHASDDTAGVVEPVSCARGRTIRAGPGSNDRHGHHLPGGGEPFGTFTALDPLCQSGTFVDEFVHPQFTPATPAGCGEAGPFAVIGGTGDYAQLRGHGDFCVFAVGEDEFRETSTGQFRLG
jgi:hypothetical protein